jgi:hypothetical protein
MSAADDIKTGLTKNLANFTKQRKAEEKQSSAFRWRSSRMREVRSASQVEVADAVMRECYMKASDNNQLPATARQIYYIARPLIEQRTDKPLSYGYFSQTLLPNFVNKNGAGWDVVYDDRGHFMEPHTKRVIGLGSLAVRNYVNRVCKLKLEPAELDAAEVVTCGPHGSFGAVLYVEKEGFMPLFQRVRLAKRYDIAIMSAKGMSNTASRTLIDAICCCGVSLLVLHDFDSAGIIIRDTLEKDTRRYSYKNAPRVIDLGLQYPDIEGLLSEPNDSKISDERLRQAGLGEGAIAFLRTQRVELNAMTSRQLINFVEAKLQQHGIEKVIPNPDTLTDTYREFAASDRLSEAFDELKERLEQESESPIEVPADLETKVRKLIADKPDITWHHAVRLIVDPDYTPDDDDDQEEGDDEDIDGENENLGEADE